MTQEKIEQLEAHGFSWENENKRSLKWREMYDKLVLFHEGKCNSLDIECSSTGLELFTNFHG